MHSRASLEEGIEATLLVLGEMARANVTVETLDILLDTLRAIADTAPLEAGEHGG